MKWYSYELISLKRAGLTDGTVFVGAIACPVQFDESSNYVTANARIYVRGRMMYVRAVEDTDLVIMNAGDMTVTLAATTLEVLFDEQLGPPDGYTQGAIDSHISTIQSMEGRTLWQ